jgi:hypothetical protein
MNPRLLKTVSPKPRTHKNIDPPEGYPNPARRSPRKPSIIATKP